MFISRPRIQRSLQKMLGKKGGVSSLSGSGENDATLGGRPLFTILEPTGLFLGAEEQQSSQ